MLNDQSEYPPISDYAIIGNCRTAALVSRSGAIDWLCLPRFDGPSIFAALLDTRLGGTFRIAPAEPAHVTRRYLPESAVLETTFATPGGMFQLTDFMAVRGNHETGQMLWPDHEMIRIVDCLEGSVDCEAVYEPRPDYARSPARLVDRRPLGIFHEHGSGMCALRGEIPLMVRADGSRATARFQMEAGERRRVSLSFNRDDPAILAPLGDESDHRLEQSLTWWRSWVARCPYSGPYWDAVIRSAITLKLLTYAPSGAIVAAPTTSLPEEMGGARNWDYRYCWLRDASLTVRALLDLGYADEAEAFLSWVLHATRLTEPEVHVLYDIYGETRLSETELTHFEGYQGSRPVRIGNAATDQFQLDTYGEVVAAGYEYARRQERLDSTSARRLIQLGVVVCKRWREPDEGIWEVRSGPAHQHIRRRCAGSRWTGSLRSITRDTSPHQ